MRALPLLTLSFLLACGGPEEADRVRMPVLASAYGLVPATTDLGYEVEFTEARAVVEALRFYAPGKVALRDLLLPRAWAHPGHHHGGEVLGELRGPFVVDWLLEGQVGHATLLAGRYVNAGYAFAVGREADGLAPGDPLLGHAAILRGRALEGETVLPFTVLLAPPHHEMDGVPFEATVEGDDARRIELRLLSSSHGHTLFDDVDFLALSAGPGEPLVLSPEAEGLLAEAHAKVQRAFFRHRFHEVRVVRAP